ncbi:hypothetical protein LTR56_016033 [Elasticomyces elasticus]|nr:hypothetical protein LTR56_016033 [Elasticomyces elasticus]KAK3642479.1 hypothetical protein LTR22_016113 [Elasticomyces elasticus]KAK4926962.1 hypothetical protein LTR49_006119 [Elasticomyces elasticus]KAK5764290.1 hypothetical protein LTS12_005503 [Elasticomyces elasticus]
MSAENSSATAKGFTDFAVINVLGPPGAGKGTLAAHLAKQYSLSHFSVGDSLREWLHDEKNRGTPLAAAIQDKLDNQGFLDSAELDPFIRTAIKTAVSDGRNGLLIDGYPRCFEQMQSLDSWPFEDDLPRQPLQAPDLVLAIRVSKVNAQARYVGRTRDARDSYEKFEKRFAEYEAETMPVEEIYRERGILVDIDANGTKAENVAELERQLGESTIWRSRLLRALTRADHMP